MAKASSVALYLVSLLDLISEGKVELGTMITAIREAPVHAFRERIDETGNNLLQKSICILRKGNPETPVFSILTEIVHKDPVSVRMTNDLAQLPLHLACDHGAFESFNSRTYACIVELLVDVYPASTVARDNLGHVPLHCAVLALQYHEWDDSSSMFETIITSDAAKAKDSAGCIPLHYLAILPDKDQTMFRAVLKAYPLGALTATANSGDLPIHCCVRTGNVDLFQELAELYPESLAVRNRCGELPMEVTRITDGLSIGISKPSPWSMSSTNKMEVPPLHSNLLVQHCPLEERSQTPSMTLDDRSDLLITASSSSESEAPEHLDQGKETDDGSKSMVTQRHEVEAPRYHDQGNTMDDGSKSMATVSASSEAEAPEHLDQGKKMDDGFNPMETASVSSEAEAPIHLNQGKETVSNLEQRVLDLEAQLDLERAKCMRQVSWLQAELAQTKKQVDQGKLKEASLEKQISELEIQKKELIDKMTQRKLSERRESDLMKQVLELEIQNSNNKDLLKNVQTKVRRTERQVDQGKEKELYLAKQAVNLREQVSDLEKQLELEKTKCKKTVKSLRKELDQTGKALGSYAKTRRSENEVLASNVPVNNNASSTPIAQPPDECLTDLSTNPVSSLTQLLLRAQDQPREENFNNAMVRSINSEPVTMEAESLETGGLNSVESARKRARVSLLPLSGPRG